MEASMDPAWTRIILISHAAATLAMVGIIWFVQIVHYPLFSDVGLDQFVGYEARNVNRTTWVVAPLMLVEFSTAFLIAWWNLSGNESSHAFAWVALSLLGLIWLSTYAIQVPLHSQLAQQFDPVAHARLVSSNWIRTVLWSIRGGLALWMIR